MKRKYITLKIPKPTLEELFMAPFAVLMGSVVFLGLTLVFCLLLETVFGIKLLNL